MSMAVQFHLQQRVILVLCLVAVLIGVMARLATLGSKSLWYDEAYTVQRAAFPIEGVWSESGRARTDSHPPLYYAGLHYWMAATGRSEVVLRLPSALASVANLGLVYLLSRRLFGQPTALFAVALLALAPLDLWYAQEARMYIFMCTIGLLLAIGLWWNHWLALPLLTMVCTIGLYLDYTMLPIWAGISAVWLADWWQNGRSRRAFIFWLVSASIAWLIFQPWYPNFANMLDRIDDVTMFQRIRAALGLPDLTGQHFLFPLAGLTLVLILLTPVLQRWLVRLASRRWFVWSAVLIFALLTVGTLYPRFYSVKRVVVQGWPFVVILVAWLLAMQKSHRERLWQQLLAVSLVSLLIILFFVPKDDWRGAVAYINQHAQPEAILLLDPPWLHDVVSLYEPVIGTRRSNPETFEQLRGRPVWLISERYPNLPIPYTPAETWLDANLELVSAVPFFRLEVRHYQSK